MGRWVARPLSGRLGGRPGPVGSPAVRPLGGCGWATAALAGFFAPLAELAAVLWTHSELVLHLAAAYGEDPTHPDRPSTCWC
ncbi:hypothetical protein JNW90_13030 [Micromonospora sp. STR1s_5]|nr:hypothetical protein [Micromonospora sp. STR1s_5]